MRVLVVEDEPKISALITNNLKSEGYVVDSVHDCKNGFLKATSVEYDLIIVDINLPDGNGLDLCKKIRLQKIKTPVIIITGEDGIDTKLHAFHSGIDDYIVKPFSLQELHARMRAILRRVHDNDEMNDIITVGDLTIDISKRLVTRAGKNIHLPNKQYILLLFLAQNKGRALPRSTILEHVWKKNFDLLETTVDVHVCYLRNKIDKGFDTPLIHTVHGSGYKLDVMQ